MTSPLKSIVVGTAGHIDHGKTTLIRALTGIDTDRLPDEKRRGITIDLGYASLNGNAPDGTPLRISFVDVPGHADFIRNMLAGAGCVDAVMLLIAADEGVKPQTVEHLTICGLLGIERGIVVISKTDTVGAARIAEVGREIERLLAESVFASNEPKILPISAQTGDGLESLRRELYLLAEKAKSRNPDYLPRLPLDRAFSIKGFGTVVTGTLLSGEFHSGESLTLQPGGQLMRVRGIEIHGRSEERVSSSSRIALNLAGIEVSQLSRGQTIVAPETLTATKSIDAEVTMLQAAEALKHRSQVRLHAFASDTLASVSIYGYNSAEAGTKKIMRITLQEALVLLPGDRFVLRQLSPAATIGGGRVLDAHPIPKLSKAKCLAWLESMKDASIEQQLRLRIDRREGHGLSLQDLIRETGLTREAVRSKLDVLVRIEELVEVTGELFLTKRVAIAASDAILNRLKGRRDPQGVKLSEVKSQSGINGEVCEALIERMVIDRTLYREGELVWSVEAAAQRPITDDPLLINLEAVYKHAGLASPSTAEVAKQLGIRDERLRGLMTKLLRDKLLIRMGSDPIYIHGTALEALRARFAEKRGETIDVTAFKQMTGLSRKYAIPLLEYLDREHITRKDGDRRLVL